MKYSTLLDQFIMPFANDFSDTPYYEDMFEFAITAWNLGNMMVLLPLKDSEEAIKTVHDMSINRELMRVILKNIRILLWILRLKKPMRILY